MNHPRLPFRPSKVYNDFLFIFEVHGTKINTEINYIGVYHAKIGDTIATMMESIIIHLIHHFFEPNDDLNLIKKFHFLFDEVIWL